MKGIVLRYDTAAIRGVRAIIHTYLTFRCTYVEETEQRVQSALRLYRRKDTFFLKNMLVGPVLFSILHLYCSNYKIVITLSQLENHLVVGEAWQMRCIWCGKRYVNVLK
jgi:hypothetical protein